MCSEPQQATWKVSPLFQKFASKTKLFVIGSAFSTFYIWYRTAMAFKAPYIPTENCPLNLSLSMVEPLCYGPIIIHNIMLIYTHTHTRVKPLRSAHYSAPVSDITINEACLSNEPNNTTNSTLLIQLSSSSANHTTSMPSQPSLKKNSTYTVEPLH